MAAARAKFSEGQLREAAPSRSPSWGEAWLLPATAQTKLPEGWPRKPHARTPARRAGAWLLLATAGAKLSEGQPRAATPFPARQTAATHRFSWPLLGQNCSRGSQRKLCPPPPLAESSTAWTKLPEEWPRKAAHRPPPTLRARVWLLLATAVAKLSEWQPRKAANQVVAEESYPRSPSQGGVRLLPAIQNGGGVVFSHCGLASWPNHGTEKTHPQHHDVTML